LAHKGFAGVPLELARSDAQPGEGRRFVITFDDGYAETLDVALPVLKARSLPAIVFVVSGLIGGRATWNADPQRLLSRAGLLELDAAGVFIGSHSRTHPRLSTLGNDAIDEEVRGSRQELEDLLGREVRFLAYPHHDRDERVVAAVEKAGYAGAAAGRQGNHARYNLHRIDAGRMSTRELALHVSGVHRWVRRQPFARAIRDLALRLS
jgi:peptidoglycan/xylan/chitin deacetylase (PgdA/CDA1 family)